MFSEEGAGLVECHQFVLVLQGVQHYNMWCIVEIDGAKMMYSVHGVNSQMFALLLGFFRVVRLLQIYLALDDG